MPINPENLQLDPKNWKLIRQQVLDRAHNHCEFCGVLNGLSVFNGERWCNVVLTVVHMDNDPTNNDPSNLRALCQRCHLQYKAKHHAYTRHVSKASGDQSLTIDFEE